MLTHVLLPIAAAGFALAQAPAPTRDFSVPRPAPSPNADPHDTDNLRLVGKRFEFDELPYKVDTAETARGIQVGFNRCNETTFSQTSMCQTIIVNSIEDFCIYIPPTLMEVGNAEAGMVAACTKPTHGARLIPQGALTAVQFLRSPSYVAVTGRINQQLLNIPAGDTGGEVDSGGQDQRGNPIGAMAYSEVLPYSEGRITQSPVWHQFIGSDMFCMKLCDVRAPNAMGLCEHVFDTYGCGVNVPAAYEPNVFESCDSDDQLPVQPGVTDIPATSNCVRHTSAAIYTGLPSVSGSTPTTSTPAPSGTGSRSSGTSNTRTGSAPDSSSTDPSQGDAAIGKMSFSLLAALVPVVAGLVGAAYVA